MKILHTVEFYHPSVGGMQEVVRQLSEYLASRGHDVTVATTKLPNRKGNVYNSIKIQEFAITGNAVRGYWGNTGVYQQFLVNSQFDVVTNFAAQQWTADLSLPILADIQAVKVFVPTGFSGLHNPDYQEYFRLMPDRMKQYDANVFLSERYQDFEFASRNGISNRVLIPNGASEKEFAMGPDSLFRHRLGISERDFLILHVGSHTGKKGHAEMIEIFSRADLGDATLMIVGNIARNTCFFSCALKAWTSQWKRKIGRSSKKILSLNLSRQDTVAAYHAADLFLLPSNIECSPIVLFESLATKTPFLTTDVGNAAEIIDWSGAGRLLPTKAQGGLRYADIVGSVKELEALYFDAQQRYTMGMSGYAAWKDRFTWEKIGDQYEQLYLNLLQQRQGKGKYSQ